jgi:hypothetical protein
MLQNSIDSGTVQLHFYFFYNLTTVDRGCQPLLVAHQRFIYKESSTHHPIIVSIDLQLKVFYITLRLLVAVPQD